MGENKSCFAGYLKAVWLDFVGFAFEVRPALRARESLQKCTQQQSGQTACRYQAMACHTAWRLL